jgi:hypothetical protein
VQLHDRHGLVVRVAVHVQADPAARPVHPQRALHLRPLEPTSARGGAVRPSGVASRMPWIASRRSSYAMISWPSSRAVSPIGPTGSRALRAGRPVSARASAAEPPGFVVSFAQAVRVGEGGATDGEVVGRRAARPPPLGVGLPHLGEHRALAEPAPARRHQHRYLVGVFRLHGEVLVRTKPDEPWHEAGRLDVEQRASPVQPSVHRTSPVAGPQHQRGEGELVCAGSRDVRRVTEVQPTVIESSFSLR